MGTACPPVPDMYAAQLELGPRLGSLQAAAQHGRLAGGPDRSRAPACLQVYAAGSAHSAGLSGFRLLAGTACLQQQAWAHGLQVMVELHE